MTSDRKRTTKVDRTEFLLHLLAERGTLVVMGMLGTCLAGCYDTDPISVSAQPSGVLPPDASACHICGYGQVEGLSPDCAPEQVECASTGKCLDMVRCVLETECFEDRSLNDAIVCGTPCAIALGATSADDPAVQAAFPMIECLVETCEPDCQ
jgi:hypothetical protein